MRGGKKRSERGGREETGERAEHGQDGRCGGHLRDKDDHLVELQRVQQVVEFAVLLALFQAHEVLLQAVQRQLGVVVDEDLHRVLAELAAHRADLLVQRRRVHHDLTVMTRQTQEASGE